MTEYQLLESGLQLAAPGFPPQAVDNLMEFSAMLLEKNKVMNLTAVTDPAEVVTRHFLDCAALAPCMPKNGRVLDVGTGAGFPGIPLAALCPDTEFVLLDALRKRVDFLNEVIDVLGLTNCTAVHARAEDFAKDHREEFDAATSRAVAELRTLCELSLPMVKVGGMFYAMKAADCTDEIAQSDHARAVLGADTPELLRYTVPHTDIERVIVCMKKNAATPPQYPRRFKKIQSSPL